MIEIYSGSNAALRTVLSTRIVLECLDVLNQVAIPEDALTRILQKPKLTFLLVMIVEQSLSKKLSLPGYHRDVGKAKRCREARQLIKLLIQIIDGTFQEVTT